MSAPILRSLSKASIAYGSTSLAVPAPTGVTRGDILVAAALSVGPFTLPSGFTALCAAGLPGGWAGTAQVPAGSLPGSYTAFSPANLVVAWKEATASEPASYIFGNGGSYPWAAMVAAYKDASGAQAGSARYNWSPYYVGDVGLGVQYCQGVHNHYFADATTLYDECLVVGVLATGPGYPPYGGSTTLMDRETQGLTPRGSRQIWAGLNPLLALFDGVQEVAGLRGGMSALLDGEGTSVAYTFALLPRIATTVPAVVPIQQGIYTRADALFFDPAEPTTVDAEAAFAQRLYTQNDSSFSVDGETGSTRVTATWTRRGVLA